MSTPDIEIPEDTRKSRINRAPRSETPDDFTSAAERIEAFWVAHPNGSILPEVETRQIVTEGTVYEVHTVRAYIRKDSLAERPDSVAHATRGDNDEDDVTARFPQETAETAAISRAIRNLGILTGPPKPTAAPSQMAAPQSDEQIGQAVAAAREGCDVPQKVLAAHMTARGFKWSQATVSSIEKGTRPLRLNEAQHLGELIEFGAT